MLIGVVLAPGRLPGGAVAVCRVQGRSCGPACRIQKGTVVRRCRSRSLHISCVRVRILCTIENDGLLLFVSGSGIGGRFEIRYLTWQERLCIQARLPLAHMNSESHPSCCCIPSIALRATTRNLYGSQYTTFPSMSTLSGVLTERGEEPPVLAALVPLVEGLLDSLLCVLPLADLLESVRGHGVLETLKLESVTGGHEVVVVDDLDEGLDLAALGLAGLGHALGDVRRVALDAGDNGVGERVGLGAVVDGHEEDDLLAGVASTGDDGLSVRVSICLSRFRGLSQGHSYHTASLEDYEIVSNCIVARIR